MNPLRAYRDHVRKVAERKSFLSLYDMQGQYLPWLSAGFAIWLTGSLATQPDTLAHKMCDLAGVMLCGLGLILVGWIFLSADWHRNMKRREEGKSNG